MEHAQATQFMHDLLRLMVNKGASDLFITANYPPAIKVDDNVTPISEKALSPKQSNILTQSLMDEKQQRLFESTKEGNFSLSLPGIGRFRVSVFRQQGNVGMVIRAIRATIPTIDELGLPQILKDLVMAHHGLIILAGATGTGKSTTIASMIHHRNLNSSGHIITVEDPVEFVHPHLQSIITQRDIDLDTEDWQSALNAALRQAPSVVLIGEIRSKRAMEYAMAFAETGHLCLTTLHASNANQALDRILHLFPPEKQSQLLMDLSLNLKAIISQRLVPKKEGSGRALAMEIVLNSPLISDSIFRGELLKIKEVVKRSRDLGMQTFDQSLFDLYDAEKISYENALRFADSHNDLRLMLKLQSKQAKALDFTKNNPDLDII